MEDIIGVFIPIVFMIMVGLVTKWLSDNRVRRELIGAAATPEMSEALLTSAVNNEQSSLKWGIVAVAIGLSLVTIQLAHLNTEDPIAFGLVFIFGGGGLLLHYFIWRHQENS